MNGVLSDPRWARALSFYRANFASKDLLFDDRIVATKDALEDQEREFNLRSGKYLNPEFIRTLEAAADVYRNTSWPQNDQGNAAWIATVEPLMHRYGYGLSKRLSEIYKTPWPPDSMRVDVTWYAGWAGAYTTTDPTRITISSADPANQGAAALEILFYEASHAIAGNLEKMITAQCNEQKVLLPRRDLWHAVLFFTTGELVRRLLPNYSPYAVANGLWKRAWPMYRDPIEKYWLPYLDGKASFDSALAALVRDVGKLQVTAPNAGKVRIGSDMLRKLSRDRPSLNRHVHS